MAEYTV